MTDKKEIPDDKDAIPEDMDAGMTTKAAAKFLGYSIRTMENFRRFGTGPSFYGRPRRYTKRSLIKWQEQRMQSSTSQAG